MIKRAPKLNYNRTYKLITILVFTIILSITSIIVVYNIQVKKMIHDELIGNVYHAYDLNPSILEFNENNVAILKADILIKESNYDSYFTYGGNMFTKDFDQCVGYFIVKKVNNELDVDTSHMCDMIDY